MSYPFNAQSGLIVVRATVFGPTGSLIVRLALDTGATMSSLSIEQLMMLGYDPSQSIDRVQVATGSGTEFVPRIEISRFEALGNQRESMMVLAHTLPATTKIDGLLGLDFLRGGRITIDFLKATITLS